MYTICFLRFKGPTKITLFNFLLLQNNFGKCYFSCDSFKGPILVIIAEKNDNFIVYAITAIISSIVLVLRDQLNKLLKNLNSNFATKEVTLIFL